MNASGSARQGVDGHDVDTYRRFYLVADKDDAEETDAKIGSMYA